VTSDRATFPLVGGAASPGRALAAKRPSAARRTTVRRTILRSLPDWVRGS